MPWLPVFRICHLQTTWGHSKSRRRVSELLAAGPRVISKRPPLTGGRLRSRLVLRRRGRSSMVEPQPSKLVMRVRSPPPALARLVGQGLDRRCGGLEVSRLEAGDDLAGEGERLALLPGTE